MNMGGRDGSNEGIAGQITASSREFTLNDRLSTIGSMAKTGISSGFGSIILCIGVIHGPR